MEIESKSKGLPTLPLSNLKGRWGRKRGEKTLSSTVTSPKISSLPNPSAAPTTSLPPTVPSPPKPSSPPHISSPRRSPPPPERLPPRVKVSKYIRSESELSFHVVYDSSLPLPSRSRPFPPRPLTPSSSNSPSVEPVVQFDTPTQIYDSG